MDDFEKQLAEALGRRQPSVGFEARVLAAAARQQERRWAWMLPRLRWAAALAMLAVAIGTVEYRREAAERAAGEAAKARLELALRITGEKLRKISEQMNAGDQE